MNKRTKVLVTRWVVTVVMGLAVVGIAAACKINKEKKVEPETSEIYKLFAGREDLRVTFLKDEEIADGLSSDVTIIEAFDSATFRKFMIDDLKWSEESFHLWDSLGGGHNRIGVCKFKRGNPAEDQTNRDGEDDMAIVEFNDMYVCVFHTKSVADASKIMEIKFYEHFSYVPDRDKEPEGLGVETVIQD